MKTLKRMLPLLLAIMLVLSMAPGAVASEANVYVLERPAQGSEESNLLYFSPYSFSYTYDGQATWDTIQMYAMKNTANKGEVIPTYCIDKTIKANQGTKYRRLNLEDTTYAASVAGKIRAVMLNGFYIINPGQYASDDAHWAAITAKVSAIEQAAKAAGYTVTDLTMGEAMSATQLAIWKATHGSMFSVTTFVRPSFSSQSVKYGNLCKEEIVSYTYPDGSKRYYSSLSAMPAEAAARKPDNVSAVYDYLLSLAPVGPTSKVVSQSSFVDLNDPVITPNDDGTYDISVDVTVDVQLSTGDWLTLKADLVGYTENQDADHVSVSLDGGRQNVTFTINNVPEEKINGEITLAISGEQTGNGVFMFDAVGGRESSQTMVAMDNSKMPVYAEVVAQESRVLNIEKTTHAPYNPLKGIVFDIHYVASLADYLSGDFDISSPGTCAHPDLATYSLVTQADGKASLNFTQSGLKDGVYLVVERQHPDIVAPVDPFYVIFPARYTVGSASDYVINVHPKNALKNVPIPTGSITIRKVDAQNEDRLLPGAVFEVYRPATSEEVKAEDQTLTRITGVEEYVVQVLFYDNVDQTGDKVSSVTTDENGAAGIYGLPYGTYYLLETTAPTGYNTPESPEKLTINENDENLTIEVENVKGAILPETGGTGTAAYTFGGMVLVAFSILMLLDRKRKFTAQ